MYIKHFILLSIFSKNWKYKSLPTPLIYPILLLVLWRTWSLEMCYFCHTLGHNRYALVHRTKNCMDKGNTHSQVPMGRRTVDTNNYAICDHCKFVLEMGNGCGDCCEQMPHKVSPHYCWQHCPVHAHKYRKHHWFIKLSRSFG